MRWICMEIYHKLDDTVKMRNSYRDVFVKFSYYYFLSPGL